ncbi:hypothetical protein M427DRAFT_67593 [Gonapodya prolifera JEL478]|uniref:SET domain-containing protein n=1 Tax=Gonapodya prolifera (strain JEL478) TaxID=1344416 RepID=A0A139AQL4_GONPJ|nr:hypothetical protein M427DRAFT_67593 [Gonapodya prolifera JEL478]|eukprot:KXS19040.1 hypothetical protein M427DRAFT_67593 [Gonapodya prolifera JEL478]
MLRFGDSTDGEEGRRKRQKRKQKEMPPGLRTSAGDRKGAGRKNEVGWQAEEAEGLPRMSPLLRTLYTRYMTWTHRTQEVFAARTRLPFSQQNLFSWVEKAKLSPEASAFLARQKPAVQSQSKRRNASDNSNSRNFLPGGAARSPSPVDSDDYTRVRASVLGYLIMKQFHGKSWSKVPGKSRHPNLTFNNQPFPFRQKTGVVSVSPEDPRVKDGVCCKVVATDAIEQGEILGFYDGTSSLYFEHKRQIQPFNRRLRESLAVELTLPEAFCVDDRLNFRAPFLPEGFSEQCGFHRGVATTDLPQYVVDGSTADTRSPFFWTTQINDCRVGDVWNEMRDPSRDRSDNVLLCEIVVFGFPLSFVVASKKINDGDEILLDYGEGYWREMIPIYRHNAVLQNIAQSENQRDRDEADLLQKALNPVKDLFKTQGGGGTSSGSGTIPAEFESAISNLVMRVAKHLDGVKARSERDARADRWSRDASGILAEIRAGRVPESGNGHGVPTSKGDSIMAEVPAKDTAQGAPVVEVRESIVTNSLRSVPTLADLVFTTDSDDSLSVCSTETPEPPLRELVDVTPAQEEETLDSEDDPIIISDDEIDELEGEGCLEALAAALESSSHMGGPSHRLPTALVPCIPSAQQPSLVPSVARVEQSSLVPSVIRGEQRASSSHVDEEARRRDGRELPPPLQLTERMMSPSLKRKHSGDSDGDIHLRDEASNPSPPSKRSSPVIHSPAESRPSAPSPPSSIPSSPAVAVAVTVAGSDRSATDTIARSGSDFSVASASAQGRAGDVDLTALGLSAPMIDLSRRSERVSEEVTLVGVVSPDGESSGTHQERERSMRSQRAPIGPGRAYRSFPPRLALSTKVEMDSFGLEVESDDEDADDVVVDNRKQLPHPPPSVVRTGSSPSLGAPISRATSSPIVVSEDVDDPERFSCESARTGALPVNPTTPRPPPFVIHWPEPFAFVEEDGVIILD